MTLQFVEGKSRRDPVDQRAETGPPHLNYVSPIRYLTSCSRGCAGGAVVGSEEAAGGGDDEIPADPRRLTGLADSCRSWVGGIFGPRGDHGGVRASRFGVAGGGPIPIG
jgi:hypothetical protein